MRLTRKNVLLTLTILGAAFLAPISAKADNIHSLVNHYADRHGVPRTIAHSVIRIESNYRPHLTGRRGEIGLGQIKCQTARGEGFTGSCRALYNPATNLNYSMSYLSKALSRGGRSCAGVSLYNTGLYARPVCRAYGQKVLRLAGRM